MFLLLELLFWKDTLQQIVLKETFKIDISFGFFFFSMVIWITLFLIYSWNPFSGDVYRFSLNSFRHSPPSTLEGSSPFAIRTGISAHVAIFLAAPWKGLTYLFRFFKSGCSCSRCFIFLRKWLSCVLMESSILFYSLILLGVQLEYRNL